MNEEQKDINRRVALALGWSGLEDEAVYTTEAWPDGLPVGEAREGCISYSGWFGWEPGAGEGFDKKPVPDFCRDPAALGLLKAYMRELQVEYETCWNRRMEVHRAKVEPFPLTEYRAWFERSDEGEGVALCLAFLDAYEDSKKWEEYRATHEKAVKAAP